MKPPEPCSVFDLYVLIHVSLIQTHYSSWSLVPSFRSFGREQTGHSLWRHACNWCCCLSVNKNILLSTSERNCALNADRTICSSVPLNDWTRDHFSSAQWEHLHWTCEIPAIAELKPQPDVSSKHSALVDIRVRRWWLWAIQWKKCLLHFVYYSIIVSAWLAVPL